MGACKKKAKLNRERKVQMRRMWREGQRRSPRISALDARKAQPSRSPVARTRCSTTTVTSTNTSLHVEHQQKKRRCLDNGEGPASRTRATKKRKLRPLQDVGSPPSAQQDPKSSDEQDGRQKSQGNLIRNSGPDQPIVQCKDRTKNGDPVSKPVSIISGQSLSAPYVSQMPKKHILELILDILQRRDAYEIFAEPVDPNEVEDYYEIIKEPMDFGTMRAKLHEGMYNSLEQFEHDVFLIPRNAMHFNSSGTIFFRQARAIDELAKKVFHVLKTDPENFELEFSGTRRRASRRPKSEAKSSTYSSVSKLATNSRSNNVTPSASGKPVCNSANSIANLRTAGQVIPRCAAGGISAQSDTRDVEVPLGFGVDRRSGSSEADRRSTYKPWLSILSENHSIVSKIYTNSKMLMHVNQQDISYKKSLMLFVKDLGPTAQMIAQRKLSGWSTEANNYLYSDSNWPKAPNCKNYVTTSFAQCVPTSADTSTTIKKSQNLSSGDRIDMGNADKGKSSYSCDQIGTSGASVAVASQDNGTSTFGAIRLEAVSSNDTKVEGISKDNNFQQNQNGRIQIGLHSSIINARDMNFSDAGLNDKDLKSTKLKMEKSKMDDKPWLLNSAFKDSFSSSSWSLESMASGASGFGQTRGSMNNLSVQYLIGYDQGGIHELGSSTETDWSLKSNEASTQVSQFIFDLPFLRTRLDEMKHLGQKRFLQESSGGQGGFVDRMSESYRDKPPHSSLDTQLASLALQL
ncbi:bromodomain-containing protein DDB_G0270170 isoform X7 [Manihot esculenta]|nr:bromodomain-containing protein DDB_G0270170 isoform X7 [Manihot esculenta]